MPAAVPAHKEFDKLVQIRDRVGNVVEENHYAYHIINGTPYFERPIASGNLFQPNGDPCGRFIDRVALKVDASAKHIEFKPAPSGAELISIERDSARAESEALRKELAALKAESDAKVAKVAPALSEAFSDTVPTAPNKWSQHAADKED